MLYDTIKEQKERSLGLLPANEGTQSRSFHQSEAAGLGWLDAAGYIFINRDLIIPV